MRTMRSMAAALLFLAVAGARAADVYDIDAAHSQIGFSVKYMGLSRVPGSFGKFEGTITLALEDPTAAKVEAVIETASIDTANEKRDEHLRGADFFDASKHPKIRFVSTRNTPLKDGRFVMEGKLTMRGVTRPVRLDVVFDGKAKDPWGNDRAGFTATGTLNRKDFKINWNKVLDNGGRVVSDEVGIVLEISAVKRAPKK
jgi:polyisoprenoid-binding protein YceI